MQGITEEKADARGLKGTVGKCLVRKERLAASLVLLYGWREPLKEPWKGSVEWQAREGTGNERSRVGKAARKWMVKA